jgi:predicted GNAT family N-acyltransferase
MDPETLYTTEYSPADRASCLEAFKTNVPLYFTVPEIDQFETWLNKMEEEHEGSHYYVVKDNNAVIACGGFAYNSEKNTATLAWGMVHKEYHRHGIGKKLLIHRLDKIQELYPEANILLDTTQYSYPFFEKYGFVITGYKVDGYAIGMHRYDMVLSGR